MRCETTSESAPQVITPHDDVPEDHTVGYAIASFTAVRVGELAGFRWRDLDTKARPLWRWALRTHTTGSR